MSKPKLIRITTVPQSLAILLKGQLGFMKQHFDVIGISSKSALLQEVEKNEGVRTLSVNMTRQITPIKDFVALYKLYKILKSEKPYIVHTHTPKAGLLGMIASYLAKVPNRLHTIAGLPVMEAKGLKRHILLGVEKITYACATKVYPNSKGLQDFVLEQKLITKTKLRIIGKGSSNGIDTNYFNKSNFNESDLLNLKETLKVTSNDFVYIFVGRLVTDKGINEMVEAFSTISKDNSRVKLLLVGPLESDLDPLQSFTLNQIETNNQIISVGFQKDVRPYLAISNALVFPSYREGFPNVVMQAGAMGLPAIVSNINGCNEIIENNFNGLIIPTKDSGLLKEKMELILKNSDLCKKMSANSRQKIVVNYNQKYIWEELLQEYKKL